MEKSFWHQRWQENKTPFHESDVNPALINNFSRLALASGSRMFVPLCGKTVDIGWLLSRGYRVAGAELSPLAITQLFAQLGVQPKVTSLGKMDHYSAENIGIFVGDIFDLSRDML